MNASGAEVEMGESGTPPHVHVFPAESQATIELGVAGRHPRLRENFRMKPAVLAKALQVVFERQQMSMKKWREIHG